MLLSKTRVSLIFLMLTIIHLVFGTVYVNSLLFFFSIALENVLVKWKNWHTKVCFLNFLLNVVCRPTLASQKSAAYLYTEGHTLVCKVHRDVKNIPGNVCPGDLFCFV